MKKHVWALLFAIQLLALSNLSTAFAQSSCPNLFGQRSGDSRHPTIAVTALPRPHGYEGKAIHELELRAVKEIIRRAEPMFIKLEATPREAHIGYHDFNQGLPNFDFIYVAAAKEFHDNRRPSVAATIHELTHLYFGHALKNWYEARLGTAGYSSHIEQLELRLEVLRKIKPRPAEYDQVNDEVEKLMNDFTARERSSNLPNLMESPFRDSLDEFYADLGAVLVLDDPNAISAIPNVGAGRSFSVGLVAAGWREQEDHALYGPARSYIGHHLFKQPMTLAMKQRLVRDVFKVLTDELYDLETERHAGDLSPEIRNGRLIERLKQVLRQRP